MLIHLVLGVWTGTAAAADAIVLYGAEGWTPAAEDEMRAMVADVGKRSPADLKLTQYGAFRSSLSPRWSGGGTFTHCEAETVPTSIVSEATETATSALLYLKLDEATAALSAARAQLPCLADPVPTAATARLGLLQGVISVENKDKAAAFSHFNWASRFDPGLVWDEQYPPDGKALLAVAQQELANTEPVTLQLAAPLEAERALWLNGTRIEGASDTLALAPGEQLIQVRGSEGVKGYSVQVEPSTSPTLLLPELLPEDLSWATDDAGRARLSEVFSSVYESDTAVFVAESDGLWRTHVGTPDWIELVPPSKSAVAKARGSLPTMAWIGAGATTVAATGTLLMLGGSFALSNRIDTQQNRFVNASKRGAIGDAEAAYWAELDLRKQRTQNWLGTGIGTALTTVGVVYTLPLFKEGAR